MRTRGVNGDGKANFIFYIVVMTYTKYFSGKSYKRLDYKTKITLQWGVSFRFRTSRPFGTLLELSFKTSSSLVQVCCYYFILLSSANFRNWLLRDLCGHSNVFSWNECSKTNLFVIVLRSSTIPREHSYLISS